VEGDHFGTIALRMSQDGAPANLRPNSPEELRGYSEDDLYELMRDNRNGVYYDWAKVELQRRQMSALQDATRQVRQEVAILSSSSDRLEALTKRLNKLTLVLIVLTVPLVVIEVWKAFSNGR